MGDTTRGDYSGTPCSDCGDPKETCIAHNGHLVPAGASGIFCPHCMQDRVEDAEFGEKPRPLGTRAEPRPIHKSILRSIRSAKDMGIYRPMFTCYMIDLLVRTAIPENHDAIETAILDATPGSEFKKVRAPALEHIKKERERHAKKAATKAD